MEFNCFSMFLHLKFMIVHLKFILISLIGLGCWLRYVYVCWELKDPSFCKPETKWAMSTICCSLMMLESLMGASVFLIPCIPSNSFFLGIYKEFLSNLFLTAANSYWVINPLSFLNCPNFKTALSSLSRNFKI